MSRIVHFEINADDPQRAVAFYQNVFGWEIKKWRIGSAGPLFNTAAPEPGDMSRQ